MSNRPLLIFAGSAIPYPGVNLWRAAVNYVTDGDTSWVERDTGCRHTQLIELRLMGCRIDWTLRGFNAAERFTEGGKIVTAEVKRLCPVASVCLIITQPDTEKYGRWLSCMLIGPYNRATDQESVDADPQDVRQINGASYIDLASYLVRKFPDAAKWQEY